jgi:hypothetical protein
LNKEEFYLSKDDQKRNAVIFWDFLVREDRLQVLVDLFRKLEDILYNPKQFTSVSIIENLVQDSIGVPLPFRLNLINPSARAFLTIAWCPYYSSCGLMLGSKFGDFHAKMEQILIDSLLDSKLSACSLLFLDAIWYCPRFCKDEKKQEEACQNATTNEPAAGRSTDLEPLETVTDENENPKTAVEIEECEDKLDPDTLSLLVAIQVLSLRIVGVEIDTCRFMSAVVKSAMTLVEQASNDTPVNFWKVQDPTLSLIFKDSTKIFYSPHTSAFFHQFKHIQKVIDGEAKQWSNATASFISTVPDASFLDKLPRVIFQEIFLYGSFFFGSFDSVDFFNFGDACFDAIRSNSTDGNLHIMLKGAPSFSCMTKSVLALYDVQTSDLKPGTIRSAIAPRLSHDAVAKYKEKIKSSETFDIVPFVRQPVYFERAGSRRP